MIGQGRLWRHTANLVGVDLEGSGAQDRDAEAILEIAVVHLVDGRPDVRTSYSTLINPQRRIPPAPWISPGITDQALSLAPTLEHITPTLLTLLDGAVLVGHDIAPDQRLLQRRLPSLHVDALIDTVALARRVLGRGGSLTALLDALGLTGRVDAAVPAGLQHRALWRAVGATLLLDDLIRRHWRREPELEEILTVAAPTGHDLAPLSPFDQPADPPLLPDRSGNGEVPG